MRWAGSGVETPRPGGRIGAKQGERSQREISAISTGKALVFGGVEHRDGTWHRGQTPLPAEHLFEGVPVRPEGHHHRPGLL